MREYGRTADRAAVRKRADAREKELSDYGRDVSITSSVFAQINVGHDDTRARIDLGI